MTVAPNKCEYIKFSSKLKPAPSMQLNPMLNHAKIPSVSKVRDLGIYFSENLSFTHHYGLIIRKAHQRINSFFAILKHSTWNIFIKCYTVYVRPLLEYGSIITSPIIKDHVIMMESVQKSFIFRVFQKFKRPYTSYFEALIECNLKSLEYRRLITDLVFTYKLIVSNEICMEDPIFELISHTGTLRRHKYYLRSLLKNSKKLSCQTLSNRIIRCWNSLPAGVFPAKPCTAAFKYRLSLCDLSHFLVLNPTNY